MQQQYIAEIMNGCNARQQMWFKSHNPKVLPASSSSDTST